MMCIQYTGHHTLIQVTILLARERSVVRSLCLSFVQNGYEVNEGEGFSHALFTSRLVAFSFSGFTLFQKTSLSATLFSVDCSQQLKG